MTDERTLGLIEYTGGIAQAGPWLLDETESGDSRLVDAAGHPVDLASQVNLHLIAMLTAHGPDLIREVRQHRSSR